MEETIKILNEIGTEIVSQIKGILIKNRKRATGALLNSVDYSVSEGKLSISYEDYGPSTKNSRTGAFSGVVDQGRRAGSKQPPIDPILNWLKTKRIKWTSGGSSKDVLSKNIKKATSAESKNKQMAFVISRSIGNEGIRPVNFTEPLKHISNLEPKNSDKFQNYLDKILKK